MPEPFKLTQCQSITIEKFHTLDLNKYLMEPKIDGWRIQIDVTPDGVQAWTRTNHNASGKLPHVEHQLKHMSAGHLLRLDGEAVFIDDKGEPDYNYTARCLGSGLDVCVDKQRERGFLSYFVFDILKYDDKDLRAAPLSLRKDFLRNVLSTSESVDVVLGNAPSIDEHYRNIGAFKEGSVLKDIDSGYPGRRHKAWLKWKAEETIEVRIIGYKAGQGKFADLIGAIKFQAANGTQGYCSGMDDETRVDISNHKDEYRGKIIEIKHYGMLVDGYRHPQFVRFRMDK
jgi:ATP-dependent DNA ligase